ncbi:MAG: oligopeptide/dipeptide ABC transporter ATP-binding protein [Chloroflexota bacterium]
MAATAGDLTSGATGTPLLSVVDLEKSFPVRLGFRRRAAVSAVDRVSFELRRGETLGIVGESGCGKSTTARLILGLIRIDAGRVVFDGRELFGAGGLDRKQRSRDIQMVFQDPYSSVNPRMSIGDTVGFPLKAHGVPSDVVRERTAELLRMVGLHANHASYFPHQMSGGQLQRVNIARALALEPKLIVCDEPVSALDKSIQAQVLNLLKDLQSELHLTYVFISHDLNVVEYMSDRVLVMYLGQVVESCESSELYGHPLHPYTQLLLASMPSTDPHERTEYDPTGGELPSPLNPPSGCRFRTRCPSVLEICCVERPVERFPRAGHAVACHLYADESAEPVRLSEVPV